MMTVLAQYALCVLHESGEGVDLAKSFSNSSNGLANKIEVQSAVAWSPGGVRLAKCAFSCGSEVDRFRSMDISRGKEEQMKTRSVSATATENTPPWDLPNDNHSIPLCEWWPVGGKTWKVYTQDPDFARLLGKQGFITATYANERGVFGWHFTIPPARVARVARLAEASRQSRAATNRKAGC
jgi:hypothetical protein